eukprot:GHVU01022407.1.p1 GENE.GHVU01022407.1~~GHVU01022407.1.p1  ORF type:complete len:204 (-),score=16.34 GHVU01022407.1:719-1330(-)
MYPPTVQPPTAMSTSPFGSPSRQVVYGPYDYYGQAADPYYGYPAAYSEYPPLVYEDPYPSYSYPQVAAYEYPSYSTAYYPASAPYETYAPPATYPPYYSTGPTSYPPTYSYPAAGYGASSFLPTYSYQWGSPAYENDDGFGNESIIKPSAATRPNVFDSVMSDPMPKPIDGKAGPESERGDMPPKYSVKPKSKKRRKKMWCCC